MDRHAEPAGVLHGAQVQDLGTGGGQLEGLLRGEALELAGRGHDARVRRVHPVHVRVDLAHVRAERGRQRHRGGVRAAAAHGGDVLRLGAHPLEAGDDGHRAGVEGLPHALRADLHDPRAAVGGVRHHAGLRAGEGAGVHALRVDGHGQQGHGDALARGEQDIHLTGGGVVGELGGEVEQLVRGVAHGGHHHADLVAGALRGDDAAGHALDALGVGHGGAAELLDDQAHGTGSFRTGRRTGRGRTAREGPAPGRGWGQSRGACQGHPAGDPRRPPGGRGRGRRGSSRGRIPGRRAGPRMGA